MKIFSFIVLIGLLSPAAGSACQGHRHAAAAVKAEAPKTTSDISPKARAEMSLYQLDSRWTDQNGRSIPLSSLAGKPLVAAMAYTSCTTSCPLLISDMKLIEDRLSPDERVGVRFVIFSLDPERDTPAALKALATKRGLDLSRWTLLTSTPAQVRRLAVALGVRYTPNSKTEIAHSNLVSLVDPQGRVVAQQTGLGNEPTKITAQLRHLSR